MTARISHVAAFGALCAAVLGTSTRAAADISPAIKGQWGPILLFQNTSGVPLEPLGPMHMILLKTGKVLVFGRYGPPTSCRLFDPENDTVGGRFDGPTLANSGQVHQLGCTGHAALADGKILFVGGGGEDDAQQGVRNRTTIFDPDRVDMNGVCTNCWIAQIEDLSPAHRFYPTCTTLDDGTVLTVAGYKDPDSSPFPDENANIPMIFDPTADPLSRWRILDNAEYCIPDPPSGLCPGSPDGPYGFHIGYYPFMFQLSNGLVVDAGSAWAQYNHNSAANARTLNTALDTWDDLISGPDPIRGGTAVEYGIDLIIKAGHKNNANMVTDEVWSLDATARTPVWQQLPPMLEPNILFYLIALPDGTILSVGGCNIDADGDNTFCAESEFVLNPERFDPQNPAAGWTFMAQMDEGRGTRDSFFGGVAPRRPRADRRRMRCHPHQL